MKTANTKHHTPLQGAWGLSTLPFRGLGGLLVFFLSLFSPAQANDYLEVQSHYSIYSSGRDAIHVKVPIWAYGRINNYYLADSTALWFSLTSNEKVKQVAVQFRADRQGSNIDNDGKGSGEVFVHPQPWERLSSPTPTMV